MLRKSKTVAGTKPPLPRSPPSHTPHVVGLTDSQHVPSVVWRDGLAALLEWSDSPIGVARCFLVSICPLDFFSLASRPMTALGAEHFDAHRLVQGRKSIY